MICRSCINYLPCREGSGDSAVAVDPGVLDTELARRYLVGELELLPGFLRPLLRPTWVAAVPWLMLPAQTAAETMIYAATAPADQVIGLQLCSSAKTLMLMVVKRPALTAIADPTTETNASMP